MFSLPQVISMALLEAAESGNVQACLGCMPCPSMLCIRPAPSNSCRFIWFQQLQPINTTRPALSHPAPHAHRQKSAIYAFIACTLTRTQVASSWPFSALSSSFTDVPARLHTYRKSEPCSTKAWARTTKKMRCVFMLLSVRSAHTSVCVGLGLGLVFVLVSRHG